MPMERRVKFLHPKRFWSFTVKRRCSVLLNNWRNRGLVLKGKTSLCTNFWRVQDNAFNKLVVYKRNSGDRAVAVCLAACRWNSYNQSSFCLHTAGVWGWSVWGLKVKNTDMADPGLNEINLTLPCRHQSRLNGDYDATQNETSDRWRHHSFSERTRTDLISVVLDMNDPESSGWTQQAELPPLVPEIQILGHGESILLQLCRCNLINCLGGVNSQGKGVPLWGSLITF